MCRQYEAALSDLKEALSLAPGHREIQRLIVRVEDELKAFHHVSDNSQTILPDSVVQTRPLGIPDIVPGAVCTDGSGLNDK